MAVDTARKKNFVGSGARTRNLALHFFRARATLLSCILFQLSQNPGKVAEWHEHLEAVAILSWLGFKSSPSRVFPSKEQSLTALITAPRFQCMLSLLLFLFKLNVSYYESVKKLTMKSTKKIKQVKKFT